MITLRRLLLLSLCALADCNPEYRPPVDHSPLQTPAAEAVLRHVIEHCPKKAQAELAVIVVGAEMSRPMPEFVERFRDVPGLTFIDYSRIKPGAAGGKEERFDEPTGKLVLELQISSLSSAKDGVQEAVAAWAWQQEAARARYEVKTRPEGGYDVREIEKIPLPNQEARGQ